MSPPINITTLGTRLPVPEFLGDIHRPRHSSSYPGLCPLSLAASPGLCPLLFAVPRFCPISFCPQPHPPSRHLLSLSRPLSPSLAGPPGSVPCHLSPPPITVICCSSTPGYDLCHLLPSPGFCPPLLAAYLRLCPLLFAVPLQCSVPVTCCTLSLCSRSLAVPPTLDSVPTNPPLPLESALLLLSFVLLSEHLLGEPLGQKC